MEDQTHSNVEGGCPSLCRAGCGFFGSTAFEGLCSKCYRDYQERKDARLSGTPTQAPTTSPSSSEAQARRESEYT